MNEPPKPWVPDNPHPLSNHKTELIWEGKYDEYGNRGLIRLPTLPLVLKKIETIDTTRELLLCATPDALTYLWSPI